MAINHISLLILIFISTYIFEVHCYMYGIATSMSGQVIKFDHGYDPHFQQQQRQYLLFVYTDKK